MGVVREGVVHGWSVWGFTGQLGFDSADVAVLAVLVSMVD